MAKAKKKPKNLSEGELVGIFQDTQNLKTNEVRFCFLLGAGASKSSGIPTGWELAKKWYDVLKQRLSKKELESWKDEIGFDEERLGEFYTRIYEKRFSAHPLIGYEEFKELMRGKEPSIGYVILAQVLDREPHNFVVTTNFDHLVEDAVRMYADTRPFAVGHESLAGFLSMQSDRPSIVKIHRDLFLNPMNDTESTAALKEAWKIALKPLLKDFNLLVLGYGGNDGSLMHYLCDLDLKDRKPIYWCHRKDEQLNNRVMQLLSENDYLVEIKDFDLLMYRLHDALGYNTFENLKDENHRFIGNARNRNSKLFDRLSALAKQMDNKGEDERKTVKKILPNVLEKLTVLEEEKDNETKNLGYQELIEQFPNDPNLINEYAIFIDEELKDFKKAEKFYKKALELSPNHDGYNENYAIFLNESIKDYDKAEVYYKKALELGPNYSDNHSNYATFLSNVRKNYEKAEQHFKKSLSLDPYNESSLINYSIFLTDVKKKYSLAEEIFNRAFEINTNNPDLHGNYAHFLIIAKGDFKKAEEFIESAFDNMKKYEFTKTLESELWFYRFAHYKPFYKSAIPILEKLITSEEKNMEWDFKSHIEIAKMNDHPNLEKLKYFAAALTE